MKYCTKIVNSFLRYFYGDILYNYKYSKFLLAISKFLPKRFGPYDFRFCGKNQNKIPKDCWECTFFSSDMWNRCELTKIESENFTIRENKRPFYCPLKLKNGSLIIKNCCLKIPEVCGNCMMNYIEWGDDHNFTYSKEKEQLLKNEYPSKDGWQVYWHKFKEPINGEEGSWVITKDHCTCISDEYNIIFKDKAKLLDCPFLTALKEK